MMMVAKESMTPLMQIYDWNIVHFCYIASYVIETNHEIEKMREQAMRKSRQK